MLLRAVVGSYWFPLGKGEAGCRAVSQIEEWVSQVEVVQRAGQGRGEVSKNEKKRDGRGKNKYLRHAGMYVAVEK